MSHQMAGWNQSSARTSSSPSARSQSWRRTCSSSWQAIANCCGGSRDAEAGRNEDDGMSEAEGDRMSDPRRFEEGATSPPPARPRRSPAVASRLAKTIDAAWPATGARPRASRGAPPRRRRARGAPRWPTALPRRARAAARRRTRSGIRPSRRGRGKPGCVDARQFNGCRRGGRSSRLRDRHLPRLHERQCDARDEQRTEGEQAGARSAKSKPQREPDADGHERRSLNRPGRQVSDRPLDHLRPPRFAGRGPRVPSGSAGDP